jgi:hypothetical protein
VPLPSRVAMVTSRLLAALGAPILPQELAPSVTDDFAPALVKYYSYLPHKVGRMYPITNTREMEVVHASVFPDYVVGQPYTGDYFYVGVIHHAIRHQIGQNAFNQNLLGIEYGQPTPDPLQNLEFATALDISTGDTYYEEDFVNDKTKFVLGGSGTFSVIFALGHSNPEKVPARHVELLSWLVGAVYYERLLAIRKTGAFSSADFALNTAQLESALKEAKDKSASYLESAGLLAATLG